jgi:hypothetical protein
MSYSSNYSDRSTYEADFQDRNVEQITQKNIGLIHLWMFKQMIVRAAMNIYWPLRMAGCDYLLAPIILWALID